jgi:hypothetical protein
MLLFLISFLFLGGAEFTHKKAMKSHLRLERKKATKVSSVN